MKKQHHKSMHGNNSKSSKMRKMLFGYQTVAKCVAQSGALFSSRIKCKMRVVPLSIAFHDFCGDTKNKKKMISLGGSFGFCESLFLKAVKTYWMYLK
jgi:hypothetical protein